jgi:hypothetical protein
MSHSQVYKDGNFGRLYGMEFWKPILLVKLNFNFLFN